MTPKYLGAIGTCSAPGGTAIWPAARVPGVRTITRRLVLASCLCRSNQPLGLCLLPGAAIHKHRAPLVRSPCRPSRVPSHHHILSPSPTAGARCKSQGHWTDRVGASERQSARARACQSLFRRAQPHAVTAAPTLPAFRALTAQKR